MSRKALIVGISEYQNFAPLEGAKNDSELMTKLLSTHENGEQNFQVTPLSGEVSKANLQNEITNLFNGKVTEALFYFSGHGSYENEVGYLLTTEAATVESGYAVSALLNQINKAASEHRIHSILVVLDCCYSGNMGEVLGLNSNGVFINEGITILTASRKDQIAIENNNQGLFTSILAEGLKGAASNSRGEITATTLYSYIEDKLRNEGQTPMLKTHVQECVVLRQTNPKIQVDAEKEGTHNPTKSAEDLYKILGASDWSLTKTSQESAYNHLGETRSSLKFMGFGFSKYLGESENEESPNFGLELKEAIVRCNDVASNEGTPVQVLMMNPFSKKIREYSNEAETPGRHNSVRQSMLRTLKFLEKMRDEGSKIEVRFYPESLEAKASFRMYIANDEKLFVSYYKTKYARSSSPSIPELTIERGTGPANFFLAFHSLFAYLWENGEAASYRTLFHSLNTSNLGKSEITMAIENLRACMPDGKLNTKACVVAAVAGKDSMAAIVHEIENNDSVIVLPVIIRIPTEDDRLYDRLSTLAALRKRLFQMNLSGKLAPAIILTDDSKIWSKTNSQFQNAVKGTLPSPCAGCHFYIHSIRCLVAQKLGVTRVISGDREKHGATIKFNQLASVLDEFSDFANKNYEVTLDFPLRSVSDDVDVWKHLDGIDKNNIKDLNCVFSGKGSFSSMPEGREKEIVGYIDGDVAPRFLSALRESGQ